MTSAEETKQAVPAPEGRTLADRALPYITRSWLFFFLLAVIAYFWLSTPSGTFLTHTNLQQIALTTSEVILLAIG